MRDPDYVFKLIVCGNGGVGKSTLLHRYFRGEFKENTSMTIGVSHMSEFIERNGSRVNLIIWDLGGQPRFDVLHPAYVSNSSGALLVFDMNAIDTLEQLDKWAELLRRYNGDAIPIILVGTKVDLIHDQQVLDHVYGVAARKMKELELKDICVTSAKMNYNIDETMSYLVDYLVWLAGS